MTDDTPKGNRDKMDALAVLRELCEDQAVAQFVAIHLAAPLWAEHIRELNELARAWRIARDRIEPHRGPDGAWIDRPQV